MTSKGQVRDAAIMPCLAVTRANLYRQHLRIELWWLSGCLPLRPRYPLCWTLCQRLSGSSPRGLTAVSRIQSPHGGCRFDRCTLLVRPFARDSDYCFASWVWVVVLLLLLACALMITRGGTNTNNTENISSRFTLSVGTCAYCSSSDGFDCTDPLASMAASRTPNLEDYRNSFVLSVAGLPTCMRKMHQPASPNPTPHKLEAAKTRPPVSCFCFSDAAACSLFRGSGWTQLPILHTSSPLLLRLLILYLQP